MALFLSVNSELVLVDSVHPREKMSHIFWFSRTPECSDFPRQPFIPRCLFSTHVCLVGFLCSHLKLSLDLLRLLGRTQGLPQPQEISVFCVLHLLCHSLSHRVQLMLVSLWAQKAGNLEVSGCPVLAVWSSCSPGQAAMAPCLH